MSKLNVYIKFTEWLWSKDFILNLKAQFWLVVHKVSSSSDSPPNLELNSNPCEQVQHQGVSPSSNSPHEQPIRIEDCARCRIIAWTEFNLNDNICNQYLISNVFINRNERKEKASFLHRERNMNKWSSQRFGHVSLESNDVMITYYDVTLWRWICVQKIARFHQEDHLISRFERQWARLLVELT